MKKQDEGYVLVYVMVVLLVLCLVATAILTGALRNLQGQQNAIAQMQERYAAQGMIEQVLAQLYAGTAPAEIKGWESLEPESGAILQKLTVFVDSHDSVTLTAQSGTTVITCTLVKQGDTYGYASYTTGVVPE